jgi:hypothetical protein
MLLPSTKSSDKTAYDGVLLTPDQSNKPVPLTYPFDPNGQDAIMGALPDNNLPSGFVPLSPITGMADLDPYTPWFGQ